MARLKLKDEMLLSLQMVVMSHPIIKHREDKMTVVYEIMLDIAKQYDELPEGDYVDIGPFVERLVHRDSCRNAA